VILAAQEWIKMAPFRLLADDFRQQSIEILSFARSMADRESRSPASVFPIVFPCYALVQGDSLSVILLNHCMNKSMQATGIQCFRASNPSAARPAFPC
jgi:hypothetical protein